jgi:hypothetical protein
VRSKAVLLLCLPALCFKNLFILKLDGGRELVCKRAVLAELNVTIPRLDKKMTMVLRRMVGSHFTVFDTHVC